MQLLLASLKKKREKAHKKENIIMYLTKTKVLTKRTRVLRMDIKIPQYLLKSISEV